MEKREWQMTVEEVFLHHRNHNKYGNEEHIRLSRCIKNEKQITKKKLEHFP